MKKKKRQNFSAPTVFFRVTQVEDPEKRLTIKEILRHPWLDSTNEFKTLTLTRI